jgi:hypothetical protein
VTKLGDVPIDRWLGRVLKDYSGRTDSDGCLRVSLIVF